MTRYMVFGVKVFKSGKQVASAKNLEVLSRYHRTKGYVSKSSIKKLPDGGGILMYHFPMVRMLRPNLRIMVSLRTGLPPSASGLDGHRRW